MSELFGDPIPDHPDVVLAKAHREKMERYAYLREEEPDPAADAVVELRESVAELADLLNDVCAWIAGDAIKAAALGPASWALREDADHVRDMHERAAALERRLR